MKTALFASLITLLTINSCAPINQKSKVHHAKATEPLLPVKVESSTQNEQQELDRLYAHQLDEKSVKKGQKIYRKNCLQCHGEIGQGDGPMASKYQPRPANLAVLSREVPNMKFLLMLSREHGQMPGWKKKFTDKELAHLELYLFKLSWMQQKKGSLRTN